MGFATLGEITFEASADRLRTWQEARRTGSSRWAKHEVHLGKPVQEFQGPGLDEMTLSVRLDIERGIVPRDELRKMRDARDKGSVLPFIVGGEPAGDYVIKQLSEEWKRFDAKGVLLLATVELSLEEYN